MNIFRQIQYRMDLATSTPRARRCLSWAWAATFEPQARPRAMGELLEAAMDFSDDDDDDEDNEMDWSSEEDELMKGVYSHFQGEVFPGC